MVDYAFGDIQGCYDALQRLLEALGFDDRNDRLWFVGDLVNRGNQSLAVLRFIRQLPIKPQITLGNHDLHLLSHLFAENPKMHREDTFQEILQASDGEELGHWLRHQPLIIHDEVLNTVMCHAGIFPGWTLSEAKTFGAELHSVLAGDDYRHFLNHMYGNEPSGWENSLTGMERLRFICNAFTRMRTCDAKNRLDHNFKGPLEHIPQGLYPWFDCPNRHLIPADIVFGHWAALQGRCSKANLHAIDTGCFWGNALTALRLQDKQRFSVGCEK